MNKFTIAHSCDFIAHSKVSYGCLLENNNTLNSQYTPIAHPYGVINGTSIVSIIEKNNTLNSQKKPHTLPLPVSYGVSCEYLIHWGRVTHICGGKLTIIGSDNGLSPERRQAIIWTNAGILLIGPLRTNFSEILIGIQTFSLKKISLKMSSAKWRPFCLDLNVLRENGLCYSETEW